MRPRTVKSPLFLLTVCLSAALLASACSPTATPFIPPSQAPEDAVATIVAATLAAQPPSATPPPAEAPIGDTPVSPDTSPTPLPSVTSTSLPTEAPTIQPAASSPTPTMVPLSSSTPTTVPLASPTPVTGDPRVSLGSPTFTDAMNAASYWPTGEDDYSSVEFTDGAMFFTAKTDMDTWRLLTSAPLKDFYLEVNAAFETCSGSDHYGMIVRVPDNDEANQGYLFGVDCDGRFSVSEWDGEVEPDGDWTTHIAWKANPIIASGVGAANRLGILASGDKLEFFVNGAKVAELVDGTFSAEGRVGVYVGSDETDDLRVKFTELSFWRR